MIVLDGDRLVVDGPARVAGTVEVPGDKSLSHRALLCAGLADGDSHLTHLADGEDVRATARALQQLGVAFSEPGVVHGRGPGAMCEPDDVIDCGNSGTGIRLLSGLAAGLPFTTVLTGDASLRTRPMLRVVGPLREMGAHILGRHGGDRPPLAVAGGRLRGLRHESPVASAQVKSALMFAGLSADGPVEFEAPAASRDHTERMFRALGITVQTEGPAVLSYPGVPRPLGEYRVPGDISSAAFVLAAAAVLPGSEVIVAELGVNPTRAGVLSILHDMGAEVEMRRPRDVLGEPVAEVQVRSAEKLTAVHITAALVPNLQDEIPVLAVLMSQAHGRSVIEGAGELRVKESDRLTTVTEALAAMGVEVESRPDGLVIEGPQPLRPGLVTSYGDHRIAMAFAVAGLAAPGTTVIEGAGCIATSYPGFVGDLSAVVQ